MTLIALLVALVVVTALLLSLSLAPYLATAGVAWPEQDPDHLCGYQAARIPVGRIKPRTAPRYPRQPRTEWLTDIQALVAPRPQATYTPTYTPTDAEITAFVEALLADTRRAVA